MSGEKYTVRRSVKVGGRNDHSFSGRRRWKTLKRLRRSVAPVRSADDDDVDDDDEAAAAAEEEEAGMRKVMVTMSFYV
ncbi:hypothetical protein CBR_g55383 [Chara braunii]|uniref:Uncharacterized protein n=1 Tax=Chara braunii TaxID=69332 RepID=A0A388K7N7_CHABU|nr:hypothetical protein CBR_g55383 [Chara braunii]|eukprot:GBG66039.1 hypothetical protein CBR_g55383 [Chara braunii]